jgi:hypothetical protein
MSPSPKNRAAVAAAAPAHRPAEDVAAALELWTTRDGREIPLDEMSDDHVASAIRVLSAWRNGLRRKARKRKPASDDRNPPAANGPADPILADLDHAIDRFKRLERDRRRLARRANRDDATAPKTGTKTVPKKHRSTAKAGKAPTPSRSSWPSSRKLLTRDRAR